MALNISFMPQRPRQLGRGIGHEAKPSMRSILCLENALFRDAILIRREGCEVLHILTAHKHLHSDSSLSQAD